MHQVQIGAVHAPLLTEALIVELHQVIILGMHHHDPAMPRRSFHCILNPPKVEPERLPLRMRWQHLVGKYLETRKAFRNRVAHLLEYLERQRTPQRYMEA